MSRRECIVLIGILLALFAFGIGGALLERKPPGTYFGVRANITHIWKVGS